MENQNKNLAKHIFLTGTIVAGSLLGFGAPKAINAENLFNYGSLGSGAELRTSLLNTSPNRNLEMKCGAKSDSKESKPSDAKCGDKKMESKAKDAKCGDKKMESTKTDSKTKDAKCGDKKMDSKAKDAKCGEGKCGDKKMDKKEMKESKPVEKQAEPKK